MSFANDDFSFLYNFITGGEGQAQSNKKTVHEVNTQYQLSESFAIAANIVMGKEDLGSGTVDKEWNAYLVYLNWQMSQDWAATLRYEMFQDGTATTGSTFFFGTTPEDVQSITLTTSKMLDKNSQLRFEARMDSTDKQVFDGERGASTEKDRTTLSFAWLANF